MASKGSMRRNPKLKTLVVGVAAFAALVFAGHGWYAMGLRPLQPDASPDVPTSGKVYHLEEKTSTLRIGHQLQQEGYIRSTAAFWLYCFLTRKSAHLQPGMYRFTPGMPVQVIATALADGKISAARLIVPEGYTIKQIGHRLQTERFCKEEEFEAAARPYAVKGKAGFPPPPIDSLEGYLFPGTYVFDKGLPLEDAVAQMTREFDDNFTKGNLEAIKRSSLSFHQIVTLASLIEREARVDDERPIIAGVLLNRLGKGMRLQCDATVQYALPEHKARLTLDDLHVKSPYNTYRNKGLPPGPIANPGLPSLMAALHPADTPYLFYVAANDGSGRHTFTKTFEEHKKAKSAAREEANDER